MQRGGHRPCPESAQRPTDRRHEIVGHLQTMAADLAEWMDGNIRPLQHAGDG